MAPTLLIFFIGISLGTFYVFPTILYYIFFVFSGILVLAYTNSNQKMIVICRIAIFAITALEFFTILGSSMLFNNIDSNFRVSILLTLNFDIREMITIIETLY